MVKLQEHMHMLNGYVIATLPCFIIKPCIDPIASLYGISNILRTNNEIQSYTAVDPDYFLGLLKDGQKIEIPASHYNKIVKYVSQLYIYFNGAQSNVSTETTQVYLRIHPHIYDADSAKNNRTHQDFIIIIIREERESVSNF